jgi:GNAT superfamily N-acetyltransferase
MIRKATQADRPAIHEAHMRSIREVCVHDHGVDEIRGWGHRPLGERWIQAIDDQLLWVVEHEGFIAGLANIKFSEPKKTAHIQSLYLTPEVLGKGYGKKLLDLMLVRAREAQIEKIRLDSTITAHKFYKKMGFRDCGPMSRSPIGGSPVTSFPMEMVLGET